MVQDLRETASHDYPKLLETYPDGVGGVDLQPFFDLITVHELGHAFETLGDLRLPTSWLSDIFVNLAMHAFVVTHMAASLPTLEVLATVGAGSPRLAARMRAEGYSTLEELDAHYAGGDQPMSPLNYVWFQCRWQRLAPRCSRSTARTDWPVSGIALRHGSCPRRASHSGITGPSAHIGDQPHPRTRNPRLAIGAGRPWRTQRHAERCRKTSPPSPRRHSRHQLLRSARSGSDRRPEPCLCRWERRAATNGTAVDLLVATCGEAGDWPRGSARRRMGDSRSGSAADGCHIVTNRADRPGLRGVRAAWPLRR
jgi:hypothetical protein